MKKTLLCLLTVATVTLLPAQNAPYVSEVWCPDLGNGQYKNPVLYADYSDPDACRVGDDFYMTSSSFNCIPGLQILHSRDLVNWEFAGAAIPWALHPFTDVKPQHGNHIWAPSIRWHDGRFYVFWGDPDEGVYQVNAEDVKGPWTEPVMVKEGKGIIDTTPLWDDDGHVYLVHAYAGSRAGFKSVISVCELNADATKAITPSRVVYDGHGVDPTCEGPKFYKKDGRYYIFHPAGGVQTGWQVVLRSDNVYGPYEKRVVLAQGKTNVNGPHQGAWVDTPSGESWFLHFQDVGALGRLVHLQPMEWKDGWPVIGVDKDGDGCGEPVMRHRKPNVGRDCPICNPVESDEFDGMTLGPQWQWQGNFCEKWHYCAGDRGFLRLYAARMPENTLNLWDVPNLLLQKPSAPEFVCTTKLTFMPSEKLGEACGLVVMGMDYAGVSLANTPEGIVLSRFTCVGADKGGKEKTDVTLPVKSITVEGNPDGGVATTQRSATVWLRCRFMQKGMLAKNSLDQNVQVQFSYSFDGHKYEPIGDAFQAREGKWIGCKTGVYCLRPETEQSDGGWCDVDFFRVTKK